MKKFKKILIGISIGIMSMMSKIFATNNTQILYGPPIQAMYGVPEEPSKWEILINILKLLAIPVVLLIGLIIYVKKAKVSKGEKIFVSILIILGVSALIYIFKGMQLI